MNRDHSVVFQITSKYCILDSFVDYEGYSISSKGFFPNLVVDIMVICVKFHPFQSILVHCFLNVSVHSCHLLFDQFQFALIHGPNIPGFYPILLFIALEFTSIIKVTTG